MIGILFTFAFMPKVQAFPSPSSSEQYVNDQAGVLKQETKQYMIQMAKKLQEKTQAQIAVVTVKSLEGKTVEEYANEVFRAYGIGQEGKNNGVLILCSTGERKLRIEVGYGLEGKLTDAKTGRIQDEYMVPDLKNDNYNDGLKKGFNAILQEIAEEYQVTIEGAEEVKPIKQANTSLFSSIFIISIVFSSIIARLGNKKGKIGKILYVIGITGITFFLTQSILIGIIIFFINLVLVLFGGFIGFGGRRILRRWRIPWRRIFRRRVLWRRLPRWRRILWRWRKFKKLLKQKKREIEQNNFSFPFVPAH